MFTFYILATLSSIIFILWCSAIISGIVLFSQIVILSEFDVDEMNRTVVNTSLIIFIISVLFLVSIPNTDIRLAMMKQSLPETEHALNEIIDEKIEKRRLERIENESKN